MKPESYRPPEFENEIRLQLSRNESRCVFNDLVQTTSELNPHSVSHYPSLSELEIEIGKFNQVDADRIVVSAGGDQSLERVIRLAIDPASQRTKILTHAPSFEMVNIYTHNHGGTVQSTPWFDQAFPCDQLIQQIDNSTGVVIVVSPNNPTGKVIPVDDLLKIAAAAERQGCKLLIDSAYVEFADENPTPALLSHSNIVVLRTFSKAFGLAGLRVGYLIAPDAETAATYRAAAGPFPVSGVSIALAIKALQQTERMASNVKAICEYRKLLVDLIQQCGGDPMPGQGNFVLAKFENPDKIWQGMADDGVAIRKFPNSEILKDWLRITSPTNANDWLHLAKSFIRATDAKVDIGQLQVVQTSEPTEGTAAPAESVSTTADRTATVKRETKETKIEIELNLDGTGKTKIETGIGFLDHMLTALAFHSRMDLKLKCVGDLHIDDHHTAEDCALALGTAIDQALGPRTGIVRFGYAYAPLDEAVARTVVDLSGRPWPEIHLALEREMVGTIATENITHVFTSMAMALRCSLHVDVIRGTNDHHRAEAAFKSFALALRQALVRTSGAVPSTKGVL